MQPGHARNSSTAEGAALLSGGGALPSIRRCVIASIGKSIQVLYAGRLEFFSANGFEVMGVCASSYEDEPIHARVLGRLSGLFQEVKFAPIVEVLGLNGGARQ